MLLSCPARSPPVPGYRPLPRCPACPKLCGLAPSSSDVGGAFCTWSPFMNGKSTRNSMCFRRTRYKAQPLKITSKADFGESANGSDIELSAIQTACSVTTPEEEPSSIKNNAELKLDLQLPRRRLKVSFTCDACGVRSDRLINPNAYARGTVFVQCAGCEVYHQLVDNLGLIVEYDFREESTRKEDEVDMNSIE